MNGSDATGDGDRITGPVLFLDDIRDGLMHLAALFIAPFMRFMARFRKHLGTVEKAMGVLLIVFGVLIATNTINYIAFWMLETFPVFMRIG